MAVKGPNTMANLLGNSSVPNYVKIAAAGILVSTYGAALTVAVDVYVSQGAQAQLPTIVAFVLGTGLSMALGVLGLHQGASLVETPMPTPTQTTRTTTTQTTQTGGDNASTSTP